MNHKRNKSYFITADNTLYETELPIVSKTQAVQSVSFQEAVEKGLIELPILDAYNKWRDDNPQSKCCCWGWRSGTHLSICPEQGRAHSKS